jgi:hypothetical protein
MLRFCLFILILLGSGVVCASEHFTSIQPEGNSWRVLHYVVEDGRLQVLQESTAFVHETSAQLYSKKIQAQNSSHLAPHKLMSTEKPSSPLWIATQSWSEDWEKKYAEWIEKNLTIDFFQKNNLSVDCADVPYALRWIFSRINSLPAMATLAGTNTVISHEVARSAWDNLPTHKEWNKDQKFLAALNWILDVTYTGSLFLDSYPIAINDHTVLAGVTHMLSSHAEIISRVSRGISDVPVTMTSSSVPRAVRIMNQRAFLDQYAVKASLGGFMRFRWPVKSGDGWKMTAKESMPSYSLEQFQKNLCSDQTHFAFCLFEKTHLKFAPKAIVKRILNDLETSLLFRQKTIIEGQIFCSQNDCSPGTDGWENWSTPSRDERLQELFQNSENLSATLKQSEMFQDWLARYKLLNRPSSFSLASFKDNLSAGLISFDPRDSLSARWGDSPVSVLESINSKYHDGIISREESIAASKSCRTSPGVCKENTDSLTQFSSLAIDFNLRNLISSWMKYCDKNSCPPHPYASIFQKIWLESPLPWDSVSDRRGEAGSLKGGTFLLALSVEAGVTGTLILDHDRLYRIQDQKIILRSDALAFDKNSQRLISADNGKLTIFDNSLKEIKTTPLSPSPYKIHSFENGSFFVYQTKIGFILNGQSGLSEHTFSFQKIHLSHEDARSILLTGEKNILLSSSLKSIKTSELKNPGPIGDFIPFTEDEALVTIVGESTSVGFLSAKSFTELENEAAPNFHLLRLNSSFYMVQNEDPARGFAPSLIFNSKKQIWKPSGYYSRSLMRGMDERMVFEANYSQRDLYFFQGEKIVKTPIGFQETDPVVSVTRESLYVQKVDYESQVLNFEGHEISTSREFTFGNCQSTIYVDQCQGLDSSLGFGNALRQNVDSDGYLNYSLYSFKNTPLLYGIKLFTGENLQEGQLQIKTGSGIQLSRGVILWYP